MAVSQRGAISFGLVYIPVELYTATQDNAFRFNQLSQEDLSRIRYKKVSGSSGKEVGEKDIVRGYQYDKNKYVVVTDEELESIKTEKDRSIQILLFTELNSIEPVYYNKAYYVSGEKGGEKPFALLRQAMLDEGKIAVGRTVLGNNETLLTLLPTSQGMLMETMYFHDEVRQVPKQLPKTELNEQELSMARQLVNQMAKPFEPEEYRDEYQARLREMIEKKIEGREIIASHDDADRQSVGNLMDALKASLEQTAPPPPKATRRSNRNPAAVVQ